MATDATVAASERLPKSFEGRASRAPNMGTRLKCLFFSAKNFQTVSRQEVGHRATVAQVCLVAGRKNSKFLNFPLVAIAHFIILRATAATAAVALFWHSVCGERRYDPLKLIDGRGARDIAKHFLC